MADNKGVAYRSALARRQPNCYAELIVASTQAAIDANPARYHWLDEQPRWKRWLLNVFAPADFDHTGNWLAFRGQRYYW